MGEQGELFGETRAVPARGAAKAPGRREQAQRKPATGRAGAHRPHPQRDRWPRLEVALAKPLRQTFTYLCEPGACEKAAPGVRVRVPFGQRKEVGVVVAMDSAVDLPSGRLRAIEAVLDDRPVVSAKLLELTRWISQEYACGWGEALAAVLPAPLKHARGSRKVTLIRATEAATPEVLADLEERFPKQHRVLRRLVEMACEVEARDLLRKLDLSNAPLDTLVKKGLVEKRAVEQELAALLTGDRERQRPERLSPDQSKAVAAITAAVDRHAGAAFLLHGVTGSGKTEVYLRAIEHALAAGRGAIALVPEISLTPQTVSWFTSRFGEVAVMHSRLTDAQRLTMWRRVQRGELKVVVGARSALFAPVQDLGLIVIDEEHEPSFKQQSNPRYLCRETAWQRAKSEGAVLVSGSATPSLESLAHVAAGTWTKLELRSRVGAGTLPQVEVVDMREEPPAVHGRVFSRSLRQAIEATLEKGEQGILFLNRRGFAPVLWCSACHDVVRCGSCDAPMTWHRRIDRLVCHPCADEMRVPPECPSCTAPSLRMLGIGSEKVEQVLREMFPTVRCARMDSDTMHRREDYEQTLQAFGRGDLDFLVGTQMIAKGLDFPRVTLVGIISADTALHLPDFRASERTFQLISQVAGRAGRAELAGQIVVQTDSPEHYAIRTSAAHDFEGFAKSELEQRQVLGYPPFGRLLRVVLEDEDESQVASAADALARRLDEQFAEAGLIVLGPSPAPMAQLRGRFRHHLLVKAGVRAAEPFAACREACATFAGETARPRVTVDVDPVNML
jgi:primosomal protein N' (replication factor Y)